MITAHYLLTALVVVLIPGAGVLFTLSVAIGQGRRAGIVTALGCTLGIVPHLLATLAGLAALMHASALAFQTLKLVGVAWLLWLAWQTWRDRQAFTLQAAQPAASGLSLVLRALLVNALNPKLTLFFVAFLPQFIHPERGEGLPEMLTLSAVFMALTFGVFVLYAWVADACRRHVLGSARVQAWLRRGFAASFAALGLSLAGASRH